MIFEVLKCTNVFNTSTYISSHKEFKKRFYRWEGLAVPINGSLIVQDIFHHLNFSFMGGSKLSPGVGVGVTILDG